METRTIHDLQFLLPSIDESDLKEVTSFEANELRYCLVGAADLSRIQLEDASIVGTKFSGTSLSGAAWDEVAITSVSFQRVDLSSARMQNCKLDRVHFAGCKLSGLHLSDTSFDQVIFENCRLDYATLDTVRATGPIAFLNCTLTEATLTACKWTQAVISDCRLSGVELDHCDLRGTDFRNSALDTIRGITSLRGVTITAGQLADLTAAFVADLDIQIKHPS
jgi:uncharacterized protein YjbI with pentapeptide repeats